VYRFSPCHPVERAARDLLAISWLGHRPQACDTRRNGLPVSTAGEGSAVSEWFPVSFEQQLLLDNAEEKPPSHYNIVYGYHLSASFEPDAYARAVRIVAAAHDSLRTVFRVDGSRHVQSVQPDAADTVVQHLPPLNSGGTDEADAFFRTATEEPIDLETGPLFSCGLAKVPDGWVLYHRWHHAIVDAWSVGIVTQQMSSAYNDLLRGRQPQPETGPGLAQVAESELAAAARQPDAGAFWAQVCDGAQLLRLGPERTSATSGEAGVVVRRVDLGATAMSSLTRETGFGAATLFLAAAVATAGLKPSDTPRLLPTILGLRTSAELRRFVGLLMRVVPVRVDPSAALTPADLMNQVQSATLAAWAHRKEPLGLAIELYPSIVEAMGQMPMPLLVQLLDVPGRVFEPHGCQAREIFHGFRRYTRFDMELQIRPQSPGVYEIALVFDKELASRDDDFDSLLDEFITQSRHLLRSCAAT
jgi:hypothetical protein